MVATPSRQTYINLIFLSLITFLSYTSALTGDFIWDDDSYVTENISIKDNQGLKDIWIKPGATPQYYPLVFTTFWIEYHLWGLNPFGYHAVNVCLHIINATLLWMIFAQLKMRWGFFAAAIFALHPVHVESVAWITELKNVLSGFFYMLSLSSYLKYIGIGFIEEENKKKIFYFLSLFFYICALLSKTVTCSLPVAILLILWWRRKKFLVKDFFYLAPFFCIGIVLALMTVWVEKKIVGAEGIDWTLNFLERCLIAGRALWFYASKIFWPDGLIFSYQRWEIDATIWWQYFFPVSIIVIFLILWKIKEQTGKAPLAAFFYFYITLFPALGFVDVYPMKFSFVADHFQYLASIGMIALFSGGLMFCIPDQKIKEAKAGAVFILILLGALTWNQGKIYKNSLTLFTDTIEKNPTSWMAYNNRGHIYSADKQFDLAISDFTNSIKIKPDHTAAYTNRGIAYSKKKDYDLALKDLKKAIELKRPLSAVAGAYNESGIIYGINGDCETAIQYFSKAIEIKPFYTPSHMNRSVCYKNRGRYDLALKDALYAKSLGHKIDPLYFEELKKKF